MAELDDEIGADEALNLSDPKSVRKAKAKASLRADERRQVTVELLSTKQGREWLWAILSDCYTMNARIVLSGSDYENGFNNGEREVGLRLQRLLCRADPEKFGLLVRENDKD